MIKDEEERQEKEEKQESKIPWLSIMIAGGSCYIYSRWINWNYLRAQRAFVFSETNFLKNKNYHSLLLQPISFESEFGFYTNLPAMLYASILVERHLGVFFFTGAYLANAVLSAGTQAIYQR